MRALSSIRLLIAWGKHQLDLLDRVLERREARSGQSQPPDNQHVSSGAAVMLGGQNAGRHLHFDNPIVGTERSNPIGEDYGRCIGSQDLRQAFICAQGESPTEYWKRYGLGQSAAGFVKVAS